MSKNRIWFWSISIIVVIIASFAVIKQVKSMQVKPFSPEDVKINGVKPYEIVTNTVLEQLGTPKEIKETNVEEGIFRYYQYPTFTMVTHIYDSWQKQKNVEVIEDFIITNPAFKTARGISVGDDVEKLFSKYGIAKLEEDSYYYDYEPKSDSERIQSMVVKVKNKKIVEIIFQ